MKKYTWLLITVTFMLACYACKTDKQKLKLTLISSHPVQLSFDSIDFIDGSGVRPSGENDLLFYYVSKKDSILKVKSLLTHEIKNIYHISPDEYKIFKCFTFENDTLVYLLGNKTVVKVKGNWKSFAYLPMDSIESMYTGLNALIDCYKNYFFLQISEKNGKTFIGKYSEKIFSIDGHKAKVEGYAGAFPPKFDSVEFQFRNSIRMLTPKNIYYTFEECDTVLTYDYTTLKEIGNPIAIFKDFVRPKDIPQDLTKNRDLVYLNNFILTSEFNIPIYQKQDEDQFYVAKRPQKADMEDPNIFALAKIKDKKYLGYVILPSDFYLYIHYISNNDLYYLSIDTKTWYHYRIEEL